VQEASNTSISEEVVVAFDAIGKIQDRKTKATALSAA